MTLREPFIARKPLHARTTLSVHKPFSSILLILALLTLLTACNAPVNSGAGSQAPTSALSTSTPTPAPEGAGCLIGKWELTSFDSFARAMLPTGAFDPQTLEYGSSNGGAYYVFSADGTLDAVAPGLTINFTVTIDSETQPLEFDLQGFSTARYSAKGDVLGVDSLVKDNLNLLVNYDKENMLDTSKSKEFMPLFSSPYQFQCKLDQLTLKLPNAPDAAPVEFSRLK